MKRLFLMVCAVSALTLAAEDSYLYWMVQNTISVTDNGVTTSYNWQEGNLNAWVVAYNSSTWKPGDKGESLLLYGQNQTSGALAPAGGMSTVTLTGDNSPYYARIGSGVQASTWSYFIELYNEQGTFIGRSSEGLDYATAQSAEYLRGSDLRPGTYWNVSAFTTTPAPEPSSGLLLLIGCAALALRRRKQIAA